VFRPDSYPDAVSDLLQAAKALEAERPTPATAEERAASLVGLRQVIDKCEAAFLATLAAFDTHGDGETLHGARSTAAWLKGALHLSPSDASQRVQLARELRHDLSVTIEPLTAGRITFDQVRAIGSALRPLPAEAREAAAQILTDLAEQSDAATVRAVGRQVRQAVDPDGALTAAEHDFNRRYLHLSPMLDGMVALDGLLDAEGATNVATALQPFLVPTGSDDSRTTSQRRADGLVDLARLATEHEKVGELGGNRPRLEVACPLPTLVGAPGAGAAIMPNTPGSPGLVTGRQLERIGCDAAVARVLLGPDSVPVDFGRDQRLFTSLQRKAMASRDGGCRFPDCHFPPALTDAHHVVGWVAGGESNLHNGLLLCRFHHRRVHELGWTITTVDSHQGADAAVIFRGPAGQRLVSNPRSLTPALARTLAASWWSGVPPD
jgi:Domain of unknown function (DUF222)